MDTKETKGTRGQDDRFGFGVGERGKAKATDLPREKPTGATGTPSGQLGGSRPSDGKAVLSPVHASRELILALGEWRDQVKADRANLKTPDEWERLSEQTRTDYAQKFATLGDRLPVDVAKCKKSYYVLRAAYLHEQSRAIRKNLNALDKWTKANGGADLFKSNDGVGAYMDQVRALGLDKQMAQFRAVKAITAFTGASLGVSQPSHGKRKLGALPWHWKTKLLGAVPKDSKYRVHVAAMAMCGCRPSEFEGGGVSVEKLDADTYRFHIAGKKTGTREKNGKTFTTGQALRTVTISRTDTVDKFGRVNPEFIVLDRAMAETTYMELSAKATAIRDVVIHASERAFPHLDNKPTAYSFRHAFASNLKAQNGVDSVETAAALGHASTKTQGCYGYGRSGGGGLACKAAASDAIRTPHLGREAAIKKARVKRNVVKLAATHSIHETIANAKLPVPLSLKNVVINKSFKPATTRVEPAKLDRPRPVPSFAKPMRFW